MSSREQEREEAAPLRRASEEGDAASLYELEDWTDDDDVTPALRTPVSKSRWWTRRIPRIQQSPKWQTHRRNTLLRRSVHLLAICAFLLLALISCDAIFFPSYFYPPEHYVALRDRVLREQTANINNEKIFIAASLYDPQGELLGGEWAEAVFGLAKMLGEENVFLSIYENDPDEKAQAALDAFAVRLGGVEKEFKTESLDLDKDFPHVAMPDGTMRVKRISFLADVRNRALRPLEDPNFPRYDKLLYLNDIIFDPVDAANLLFSTNQNPVTGRTQYRAACAVDFINAFKYYDTYATRDIEGYELGIPFYPWFAADTQSRRDVLGQKDAVQVKSCWGGMVAFEAKWFQQPGSESLADLPIPASSNSTTSDTTDEHTDMRDSATNATSALRFRASTDTYWDGSECCFIHADLSSLEPSYLAEGDTGIYMNPYIRVTYASNVLPWLSFTRRFERLYTPVHAFLNWLISKPSYNPRRLQQPGQEVVDRVWKWDEESQRKLREGDGTGLTGSFEGVKRTALPGGFCGLRKLSYINEHPKPGEKHYITIQAPAVD